jgi:hypothetical protein
VSAPPVQPPPASAPPIEAAAAYPSSPPAEESPVRLGFADGSDVQLHPEDPHTRALKAVADVLTLKGPHRRKRP